MSKVTQSDRDAACGLTAGGYWNEVKRGYRDADQIVQAFTRHREQAERETVEKIVAWLRNTGIGFEGSGWADCIERGKWKQ